MGCSGRFWAVKTCRDDRMHAALTRVGNCFISSVIGQYERRSTAQLVEVALGRRSRHTLQPSAHLPEPRRTRDKQHYGIMRSQRLGWVRVWAGRGEVMKRVAAFAQAVRR